ncbi:MAG: GTP-binding protein [Candidatus Heimdallarchaeota archaeon]|nr:GTP-binding protein [Candidatus Heimdallarchaeota archaeon]
MSRRKIHKIMLLGEGGVGKTSLRKTYLGENFKDDYSMTIGADFAVKRVEMDGMEIVAQIWDLAGQPRFKTIREVYYPGTAGVLLVFDLTNPYTFEQVLNWLQEMLESNQNKIVPMILIGNKSDLRDQLNGIMSKEVGLDYARKLSEWSGYEVPYVETSALSGFNVDEAFVTLLRNIEQSFLKKIIVK